MKKVSLQEFFEGTMPLDISDIGTLIHRRISDFLSTETPHINCRCPILFEDSFKDKDETKKKGDNK